MAHYAIKTWQGTWGNFSRKRDALIAAKQQREADRQAGNKGSVKVIKVSENPGVKVALRRNKGILEFLGFVDGKGRIRKAKVRKVNAVGSGSIRKYKKAYKKAKKRSITGTGWWSGGRAEAQIKEYKSRKRRKR